MNDTQTMVERLLGEDKLGMCEAGRFVGTAQGRPPIHAATVGRWCMRGIKLPDGRVLKLEHFRIGSKMYTSKPALIRFISQQTAPAASDVPAPRTPTQRQRADDAAARELEALGI